MLRLSIRFLGLLLLASGFVALIVDGSRSLAGGGLYLTSLRRGAAELAPAAYQALQVAVEQRFSPLLWDPVLTTVMLAPISVAFGALGAALIVLSHKEHEEPGHAAR